MPKLLTLYQNRRNDYTTELRSIKDNIERKERNMELYLKSPLMSEMLQRWNAEKQKSKRDSEISADLQTVERVKDAIDGREDRAEQRKDDLTRRWNNKNYNPIEKNRIGNIPLYGGSVKAYPREDIQKDYVKTIERVADAIDGRETRAETSKDDLTRRWKNKDYDPIEKNRIGKLPSGGGPTERYPREDIQKDYVKTLKDTERDFYVRRQNTNEGDDDLIKRWKNNEFNPARRSIIGIKEFSGPVGARTREERAIAIDIAKGTARYDTIGGATPNPTRHSNKYVEASVERTYQSNKSNYVYAYDSLGYYDKGVSNEGLRISFANKGFNLGQTEGYKHWNTEVNIFQNRSGNANAQYQVRSELDVHVGPPPNRELLEDLWKVRAKNIGVGSPINGKDNSQVPLDLILQQNQLLPRRGVFSALRTGTLDDGTEVTFNGFDTSFTDIQKSWDLLYTRDYINEFRNPDAEPEESLSRGTKGSVPRGFLSRTDIRDIEEPRYLKSGIATPKSGAISFEEDAQYSTYISRDRGFYSNIAGNVYGSGELLPAVWNREPVQTLETGEELDVDSQANLLANQQYFPFLFETANRSKDPYTGETKSDTFEQFAYFQGTLSQLSEQFSPSWSSSHYSGRSEEVHTYEKSSRNLDMRFVVFANSVREQQNVYERVNWLAQQVYPLYDTHPAKINGGPIIRITIGDMYKRVSGFIRSLSFNWDFLGPNKWQIQRGLRMPMACEISISFQVIHDRQPDRDTNFYQGLSEGMMSGGASFRAGNNGAADIGVGQNNDNQFITNNRDVWSPATNLIPQNISVDPNKPHEETFVSLLARHQFEYTGSGEANFVDERGNRTVTVGERFTYADIIAAAGGAEQLEDSAGRNSFEEKEGING